MKTYTDHSILIRMNGIYPRKLWLLLVILCSLILAGCEGLLEVDPPRSQVVREQVFSDDLTAEAAAGGMYGSMLTGSHFANGTNQGLLFLAGLSADELFHTSAASAFALQFEENALLADNPYVLSLWTSMYRSVYAANALMEGLETSSGVTDRTKRQLKGEALFIRAFCHFYLVNLFGDVPVITTTDYRVNAKVFREDIEAVYTQIEEDLLEAQQLLDEAYPSGGRVRPNKAVATALLARVYLYQGDWSNAETQATTLIEDTNYSLVALGDIMLANNTEALWQLHSSSMTANTPTSEGSLFFTTSHALSNDVVNAFEAGDARSSEWVRFNFDGTYYVPDKYKVTSPGGTRQEYSTVFRLAEQYLIRAEARAHQDADLSEAIADVDAIRDRAGLPLIADTHPGINQANLLDAILQERRVELFTEWAHRWLDLKRTGNAVAVLSVIKAGFTSDEELYPIPQDELNANPNLTQNAGY